MELSTPKNLWFTADGQHVYGYESFGQSLVAFMDNATATAEAHERLPIIDKLLEPTVNADGRWQVVSNLRAMRAANEGLPPFFRIEVEPGQGQVEVR